MPVGSTGNLTGSDLTSYVLHAVEYGWFADRPGSS